MVECTQWSLLFWWPLLGTPRVCVYLFHPILFVCIKFLFSYSLCIIFIFLIAERWVFAFFKINSEQKDKGHRIFILCGDDEKSKTNFNQKFQKHTFNGKWSFFLGFWTLIHPEYYNTSRRFFGWTSNHNTKNIEADPYLEHDFAGNAKIQYCRTGLVIMLQTTLSYYIHH